jgi:peptide-methionine (S)-S-oxide reductase
MIWPSKKNKLSSLFQGLVRSSLDIVPRKRGNEIAIVACGCFWNPQVRFASMDGVKQVVVGYTGGEYPNPSFRDLGDHTCALFIEYNPTKLSYFDILQMWHDNDYPWDKDEKWAHRSALFVTSQHQWEMAFLFCSELEQSRPDQTLYVDLEPAGAFYQAEEDQQDYIMKQGMLAKKQVFLWANEAVPSGLFAIEE